MEAVAEVASAAAEVVEASEVVAAGSEALAAVEAEEEEEEAPEVDEEAAAALEVKGTGHFLVASGANFAQKAFLTKCPLFFFF